MKQLVGIFMASFALLFSMTIVPSFAHPDSENTTLIPLDGTIGIEKTILTMNIPLDNALPWGFVEGKISNHVSDYPVIIQMYKYGEAAHFAQTDVEEDGSYEYRFRVLDVNSESTIKIFHGDYTIKIFKVVYLNSNSALI